MTEAEAKMFAASAGYERFMGKVEPAARAPLCCVCWRQERRPRARCRHGTGSLAAAVEANMPASQIVGVDPSEGFIAYAQKNAKSTRVHYESGMLRR